ncbi:hypothetical protein Poly30_27090 [Planctomycetes bacterium Poly30]|uniref:Uncharacterized protein n=2 Tax=Saltatorellus ferox TaxID=2528018 RepID=A0A518ESW8_9BACT|nr:hypothetical protein Poly30_27090 [Planctomycetes bacterium Poly30]
MAYRGKAYALGPNYNSPAPEAAACEVAFQALLEARAALDDETPAKRRLVEALEACFALPTPEERGALDLAYALEGYGDLFEVFHATPYEAGAQAPCS